MPDFAVLAERLAVIGGGDDEGVPGSRSKRAKQAAGFAIGDGDVLVVSRLRRLGGRLARIAVRRMRLEQVHPEKQSRVRRLTLQPRDRS